MAQLTAFGYRYRASLIHTMDARVKLAALVLMGIASLHAGSVGMMIASATALFVLSQIRIPIRQAVFELRWFLVLVLVVWLIRCLNTPGQAILAWHGIALSYGGAVAGAMISWRWLFIVCLGLCLSASTRTTEISAAVQWGLRPLLGRSAYKIGLMIGLLMRSIEIILTQARQIADAQRARAIDNRKNPIYKMKMAVIPLMRGSFLTADRMATAISSRCYGDSRTPYAWHFTRNDAIGAFAILLICAVMVLV
jgi:biotin transport system permease protein